MRNKLLSIVRTTPKQLIKALKYEYGNDYKNYVEYYSSIKAHGKLPKVYIVRIKE